MTKPQIKLSQLVPDPHNANKGTERGRYMIEHSLQKLGAGRSLLVDKNNVVIAGNKTLESAVESGFEDAIVVETDGSKLVVVKRTDLDLQQDSKAKELAIADNRASEVSLNWDLQVLQEMGEEVDLGDWWKDDELDSLLAKVDLPSEGDWGETLGALPDGDRAPFQQMTFTLHDEQAEQVKAALEVAKDMGDFTDSPNENSNGNALARICEIFLTQNGQR